MTVTSLKEQQNSCKKTTEKDHARFLTLLSATGDTGRQHVINLPLEAAM